MTLRGFRVLDDDRVALLKYKDEIFSRYMSEGHAVIHKRLVRAIRHLGSWIFSLNETTVAEFGNFPLWLISMFIKNFSSPRGSKLNAVALLPFERYLDSRF